MAKSWFIKKTAYENRPVTSAELLSMSRDGRLNPEDPVRRSDSERWTKARNVRGLAFPGNDESRKLVESLTGLAKEVAAVLDVNKSNEDTVRLARLLDEAGCDASVGIAMRSSVRSDLFDVVLCHIGHDLLYWSLMAIMADGEVAKDEIASVQPVVDAMLPAYQKRLPVFREISGKDPHKRTIRFLSAFKKDKSHYGWPQKGNEKGISLDAMIGCRLVFSAATFAKNSPLLFRYSRLVESLIQVVIGVDGVTTDEEALLARAREFHTATLEEFENHRDSPRSVVPEQELLPAAIVADSRRTQTHFRNMRWGMSRDEVIRSEGTVPFKETDEAVFFEAEIAGLKTWAVYIFSSGICCRSKYFVVETHADNQAFLHDFIRLRELLIKKYGPVEDKNIAVLDSMKDNPFSDAYWRNDLYQEDAEEVGFAVSIGHVFFLSKWKTPETEISLSWDGDNYTTQLQIEYQSRALGQIETTNKTENYLRDL